MTFYTCKLVRNSPGKSRMLQKIPEFPWIGRFSSWWNWQFVIHQPILKFGQKLSWKWRENLNVVSRKLPPVVLKKSKVRGRDYGMAMKLLYGKLHLLIHQTYLLFVSQCGNFRIFLSFRFYVKSISKILRVVKLPLLQFSEALYNDFWKFDTWKSQKFKIQSC